MKKNLLSALLIVATVNVFATVLTVSNQSPNPGQYTTIQAAINAATAGDSIYIHPSSVVYAGFSLDRQLTIISSGFEPSSANPNPYAFVNPSVASSINASGSKIIGIYFQNGFGMDVTGLHDFTLSRCILVNIGSRLPINGYNIILTENFFYQFGFSSYNGLGTAHDILISNNVFLVGGTYRPFDNIHGVTNLTVNNNLFYGYNTPLSISGGSGTSGIIFSNNIFNKVAFTSVSGCTFSNCLTYQCTGNTPWINNGTDRSEEHTSELQSR